MSIKRKQRNAYAIPAKMRKNAGAHLHKNLTRRSEKDKAIEEQLEEELKEESDNVCNDG